VSEDVRQIAEARAKLAYTPSAPITDSSLFSGRSELLEQCRQQLGTPGMSFVIYGERGVGKTSFWSVLLSGRAVHVHTAHEKSDLQAICLPLLARMRGDMVVTSRHASDTLGGKFGPSGIGVEASHDQERTEAPIGQRVLDVDYVLEKLSTQDDYDTLVIDEFQRLPDTTRRELVSLMKASADRGLRFHFVAVGVAREGELFIDDDEFREYLQRNIVAIRIPRMSELELLDIVTTRRERFAIQFESDVVPNLVWVASGYPSQLHQLALTAALTAIPPSLSGLIGQLGASSNAIGRLLAFLRPPRRKDTASLEVSVSYHYFVSALVRQVSAYELVNPEIADDFKPPEQSERQKILASYASGEAVAMPLAELARRMGRELEDMQSLVLRHADLFATEEMPNACVRPRRAALRPYVRARLVLAREGPHARPTQVQPRTI
jgi:hypothetical protein